MNAAATIARKDIREVIRDGRALAAVLVVAMLGSAALWLSVQQVSTATAERTAADARDRATWEGQGPNNPHSAAHLSSWAFKPTTALGVFDPGLTQYLGEAIWMEAHSQNPANHRAAEDASEARRFADLSPAWLIAVVLPLVVIALGFGALARERETGIWRQLAASGVPATALLCAKAVWLLGFAVGLALLVTLPSAAASVGLPVLPGAGLRWMLIVAAVVLFAAALTGVTLAVSGVARTARGALLGLIAFWMVAVVLVPRLAANAAQAIAPVPNARAFWDGVRADMDEDGGEARSKAFEAATLNRYGVTRKEDLPVSFAGLSLNESERHGDRVFDRNFGKLRAAHERQQGVLRWAGLASPVVAFRNASAAFAGTDAAHHWHFARAAEAHRRRVIAFLNDDMTRNAGSQDFDYKAGSALWAATPAFRYAAPGIDAARGGLVDLGILALWALAGAGMAVAGVRRWRAA